jgi:hypothetical protein
MSKNVFLFRDNPLNHEVVTLKKLAEMVAENESKDMIISIGLMAFKDGHVFSHMINEKDYNTGLDDDIKFPSTDEAIDYFCENCDFPRDQFVFMLRSWK